MDILKSYLYCGVENLLRRLIHVVDSTNDVDNVVGYLVPLVPLG